MSPMDTDIDLLVLSELISLSAVFISEFSLHLTRW